MMKDIRQEIPSQENSISEQAAAWFLRIQEGDCGDVKRQEFETWLDANPQHRSEYQQYVELWSNLDYLGDITPSRRKKMRAGVALVALVAIFCTMQWFASDEKIITAALGQRQHIVLSDGTAVDMNTNTIIKVTMSGLTRKVTLEQGEALFNVAHSARPFEVHAGNGVLRDIGTSFNVSHESEKTTVAVLEGEVEINLDNLAKAATVTLHGGEQLSYSAYDRSAISAADVNAATAWREGRMVFHDTPLAEVISQINRYHARRIILADARLGDLKVSGEFNTTDREGLIRALKMLFLLRSEEHEEVTTLFSPNAGRMTP